MRVDWTEPAKDDIKEIEQFLGQSSARTASSTVRRLVSRAEQAALYPRSGRVVPEYGVELIRELIAAPYRIIYELFPDRIEILAIVHSSRRLLR